MKYMLLIYQNPTTWSALSDDDRKQIMGEAGDIVNELIESGEWIGGEGLAHPSRSKTVRVRRGVPAITDGPFVEAKEQLAGYCLFECENEARALDIATRWPDARNDAVELRPLMADAGTEM